MVLAVLLVPIWPDFVDAKFVVEPARRETVRAAVPGTVKKVLVHEGQQVVAGETIAELTNLDVADDAARATAETESATAESFKAALRYSDFGPAEQTRLAALKRQQIAQSRVSALRVGAPIQGTVLTPRTTDLLGSRLNEGALIAEIGDFSGARGRVYVPEYGMRDVHAGARVILKAPGSFATMRGRVASVAPASGELPPALIGKAQLQGIKLPQYYVVSVPLNYAGLSEGLSGDAKIYVTHRSLGEFALRFIHDSIDRRVW
jgi:biotin carboxyl carrier protein